MGRMDLYGDLTLALDSRINLRPAHASAGGKTIIIARIMTGLSLRSLLSSIIWIAVSGMEDDEDIPYISGSGEGLMDEASATHAGARRNEDIALDLMKFVAMTTGYGRTTSSGVGFQGTGSASKPDEYAAQLLELYGKCRAAVEGKK